MAEQQRPKKGSFCRFWPKFEIPKNGSTDERTRAGKRFLPRAVCSGEQHWPVLLQHGFSRLAEWEEKNSITRLVMLDKNCTRQNWIMGKPRKLEKWFVYLTTLSRKTNWGVVEQHGLLHQWRSSSSPKRSVLPFLIKIWDSKKWFYGRTNESRETVRTPGSLQWSGEQHWPVL